MHNLAGLLVNKGDYAQAEPLHRRVLERRERVLGPEHPDTITSVHYLAELLHLKGSFEQSELMYGRALEGRERVLGQDHPHTLSTLSNMAGLLYHKGNLDQAELMYRRALEGREQVLGQEHPHTLSSVDDLALLLDGKGDYAQAEPLYRRIMESGERVLGREHPDTLESVHNLARLLYRRGEYAQAEPLFRRAVESRGCVLGRDHPDTLKSVHNLAGLLESKGDYAQAEPLYRRAMEARGRVLGREHPDTLGTANNLAFLLENNGNYTQAQPLYLRALLGLIVISCAIGREHPNLRACLGNYASCLSKTGLTEAEVRARIDELLGRRGGTELFEVNATQHVTPQQLRSMALKMYKEGNYSEAKEILEMLLEVSFEVLGTRLHLARIALVTDDFDTARQHIAEAWEHRTEAAPYLVPRILWLQIALSMTGQLRTASGAPETPILVGRLKAALQDETAHMEWTMDPVLSHLQPMIPPDSHALLTTLVAALNNSARLSDLDRFHVWRDAVLQPLD